MQRAESTHTDGAHARAALWRLALEGRASYASAVPLVRWWCVESVYPDVPVWLLPAKVLARRAVSRNVVVAWALGGWELVG